MNKYTINNEGQVSNENGELVTDKQELMEALKSIVPGLVQSTEKEKEEVMQTNVGTKESIGVIGVMVGNIVGNLANATVAGVKAFKEKLPTAEQVGKGIGFTVKAGETVVKGGLNAGKSVLDLGVKATVYSAKATKKSTLSFLDEMKKGYKEVRTK